MFGLFKNRISKKSLQRQIDMVLNDHLNLRRAFNSEIRRAYIGKKVKFVGGKEEHIVFHAYYDFQRETIMFNIDNKDPHPIYCFSFV